MLVGAGDEYVHAFCDVNAVHEDDSVHLACGLRYWPHRPELGASSAEGAPAASHLILRSGGEKPAQEGLEPLCVVVDPVRRGRLAGLAKPALRSCGGPAVAYLFAPAHRAFDLVRAQN